MVLTMIACVCMSQDIVDCGDVSVTESSYFIFVAFYECNTEAFVNPMTATTMLSIQNGIEICWCLIVDEHKYIVLCFQYEWRKAGGLHVGHCVKSDTNEVSLWSEHPRRTVLGPDPRPWTQRYCK